MKKKIFLLSAILLLFIAAAGVWWFITRDQRAVKELIGNVAQWVQVRQGKMAHEGVLKHTKSGNFFAPPVKIMLRKPEMNFEFGQDNLEQYWMMYFRYVESMSVRTGDISVEIADGRAVFSFDAEISGAFQRGKFDFEGIYLVSGSAEKIDGNWKISSVTVEPLVQ